MWICAGQSSAACSLIDSLPNADTLGKDKHLIAALLSLCCSVCMLAVHKHTTGGMKSRTDNNTIIHVRQNDKPTVIFIIYSLKNLSFFFSTLCSRWLGYTTANGRTRDRIKKPAWRDEDVEVRVMITDGRSKGLLHFSILEIKLEAQSWAMWKKNKEFRER